MHLTDLDMDLDTIVTGGKDCKAKVWLISDLLREEGINTPFAEFSDHTAEVTQVKLLGSTRMFSASSDKQFRVYDIPSKLCIKIVHAASAIMKAVVDHCEQNLYVACDNQNIYCYSLEANPVQNAD